MAKAKASNRLHVGVVLDRSGSMGSVWVGAIAGLNDYIGQLKDDPEQDTTYLTLGVFDDVFELIYQDAPLVEIPEFDGSEFPPRNSTALNDSIADMISVLSTSVGEDKVLVVVLTDGMENASKRYPNDRRSGKCVELISLVQEYEGRGNWTFVYLGANDPDVYETSGSMGFRHGNTAAYTSETASMSPTFAAVSTVTATRKRSAAGQSVSSFDDAGVNQDLRTDAEKQSAPLKPARTGELAEETGLLDHLGS